MNGSSQSGARRIRLSPLYRGLSPPKLFGDFWTFFRVVTGKEPMLFRSSLSAPRVTIFLLAHFLIVQTSRADSCNQIAEESRHLAEAGKSAEAIKLAEQTLPLAKSGNSPRALYSAQLTLAKCTWIRARRRKRESWQSKAEQELKHLEIPAVPEKQRIFCGNTGRFANSRCGMTKQRPIGGIKGDW
jgi:hypothetical protein